jgi:DNA-binding beta-propeller fold protein YncE
MITRLAAIICFCLALPASLPAMLQAFPLTPLQHLFDIKADFLQPSDVAVGRDGRIYVVDGVNHHVKVFDRNGAYLSSFGGRGAAPAQMNYPLGIAADTQGRVYVADAGNRRVQIFSESGNFISLLNLEPLQPERPIDPVDVAVDERHRQLYVIDNDNHNILVFGLDDQRLTGRWGSEGKGRDEFNHPFLLAVGQDSSIFVVDVLNTRVQAWSPQGAPVSSIGTWGVDVGQLYRPKGVCVDQQNRVYVSDSYLGVIQVFNRYGLLTSVLGTEQGAVMHWTTPAGIAIDEQQRLFVVEMFANRVRAYRILDSTIEGRP